MRSVKIWEGNKKKTVKKEEEKRKTRLPCPTFPRFSCNFD